MIRIALLTFTLATTLVPTDRAATVPVRAGELWSLDGGRYTMLFEACGRGLCARVVGAADPEAKALCGELLLHSLKPRDGRLAGRFLDYGARRERAVAVAGARNGASLTFLGRSVEPPRPLTRSAATLADVARTCRPEMRRG